MQYKYLQNKHLDKAALEDLQVFRKSAGSNPVDTPDKKERPSPDPLTRLSRAAAGAKLPGYATVPAALAAQATEKPERVGFFKRRRLLREAGLSPRKHRIYQREGLPAAVRFGDGPVSGLTQGLLSAEQRIGGLAKKYNIPYKTQIQGPPDMSEATLRHEIGHLQNVKAISEIPYGTEAYLASRAIGRLATPLISAAAAASKEPSRGLGYAGLAANAPTLLDEGLASARAVKGMVGEHGLKDGLRKSVSLAPALGTYASYAATPLGISRLREYANKRKDKNKQDG